MAFGFGRRLSKLALIPFVVLLLAYQLGWYGYATLQQPVNGGCCGFVDLIMPSSVAKVDTCITNNWGKGGGEKKVPPSKSKRKPGPVANPHPGHGAPPLKAPHPR